MRYRVIAQNQIEAVSSIAEDAKAALAAPLAYKKMGYERIVFKDQKDRTVAAEQVATTLIGQTREGKRRRRTLGPPDQVNSNTAGFAAIVLAGVRQERALPK